MSIKASSSGVPFMFSQFSIKIVHDEMKVSKVVGVSFILANLLRP